MKILLGNLGVGGLTSATGMPREIVTHRYDPAPTRVFPRVSGATSARPNRDARAGNRRARPEQAGPAERQQRPDGLPLPERRPISEDKASHESQHREDEEDDEEEDLRPLPRQAADSDEAEEASDQSDDEERDTQTVGCTKHGLFSNGWGDSGGMTRCSLRTTVTDLGTWLPVRRCSNAMAAWAI
jgi:hypothetical protein